MICEHHRGMLLQLLEEQGLAELVAKTDEQKQEKIQAHYAGIVDPNDFDPFLHISSRMEAVAAYVAKKYGVVSPECPVCRLDDPSYLPNMVLEATAIHLTLTQTKQ